MLFNDIIEILSSYSLDYVIILDWYFIEWFSCAFWISYWKILAMRVGLSPIFEWDDILHSLNYTTYIVFDFFTPSFWFGVGLRFFSFKQCNNHFVHSCLVRIFKIRLLNINASSSRRRLVFYDNLLFCLRSDLQVVTKRQIYLWWKSNKKK